MPVIAVMAMIGHETPTEVLIRYMAASGLLELTWPVPEGSLRIPEVK